MSNTKTDTNAAAASSDSTPSNCSLSFDEQQEADGYFAAVKDTQWEKAASCVPDGYAMVEYGKTQEGDIAYGFGWDVDRPYTMPDYEQVLDCGVGHLTAIARKII